VRQIVISVTLCYLRSIDASINELSRYKINDAILLSREAK